MKLTVRLILFGIALVLIVLLSLQVMQLSRGYSHYLGSGDISIRAHAQNIMMRTCDESFPLPDGVRIFPDGREVHHIAFLKIHKAASGTLTSIIFRYGADRHLNFLRPKWLNIISSSDTIIEKQLKNPDERPFDITTSHVIYNRKAFERFLHNDSVYIGILREPYIQFKSSMNYMAPKYVYNISQTDPIQQFLKNPSKYETKKPRFSWINNRQATEFGTPDDVIMNKNISAMIKYVKKLDKEFHLVVIAEYFDESVVLMRRMLNWKFSDILYRRLHIRGWDRKLTIPRPHDRYLYRKYAFADYALYDFFYKRLWRQIKSAGEDFFAEVLYFKQIRDETDDFCKVYPNITETFVIDANEWTPTIRVDKEFCRKIYAEEEDWVKHINSDKYSYKKP
ncbi:galactose-3-O-sulfotransferase 3-like [Mya arenaria]|uniref:galactose-3-O-sulfotransferase 3-like n=1 Tax=Mya arenaria TaxID=6604 RepID=UPI0022E00BA1|nr:galactose-3-O-sulfotransferase 3-like [Mya arenaria]